MRSIKKIIRFLLNIPISKQRTHTSVTIEKLFCGFSEQAIIDLEKIIHHSNYKPEHKANAACAIARWNQIQEDFQRTYDYLIIARNIYPKFITKPEYYRIELNCLFEMQKYDEARIRIDQLLKANPHSSALKIAKSNTFGDSSSSETEKLNLVNQIYVDHGLMTIEKLVAEQPLQLDNLSSPITHCSIPTNQEAKLSVIIPAYSAATTLHIAVRSLINQTWKNLEIIIVDDYSPDETLKSAQKIAEQDPRIKVYQTQKNGGSYAARNYGLQHSSGEFITVHDADDWSHPQKLELQIKHLIENPNFVANCSTWIRCKPNLEFCHAGQLNRNYSSLMLRKKTLLEFQGWDEVRIGADAELFRRIRARFGNDSIHQLLVNVPLSFALRSPNSLTQNSATHIRTYSYGVRRIYQEASIHYCMFFAKQNQWKTKTPEMKRVFPAPKMILPDLHETTHYDLLLIMDYCLKDESYQSTLNNLKEALNAKLRVAIFDWRRYDQNPYASILLEIRQMIHDGVIDLICPGEEVFATRVMVGHAPILEYAIDLPPKIHCEFFAILTNQTTGDFHDKKDIKYDPVRISDNVERLFNIKPTWIHQS